MNRERIRAVLGVWAPMTIGLVLIATALNFYFNAQLTGGLLEPNLEAWRGVCAAGVVFVGALLVLSTTGRYRKARAARKVPTPADGRPGTIK